MALRRWLRPRRRAALGGGHDLEVVGECPYQATLWDLAGGRRPERVRVAVDAVLRPEYDNLHDVNAIAVLVDDRQVGLLSRADAAVYRPGLLALRARTGRDVALRGEVAGGGRRDHGAGPLGVWLSHDPADFGVAALVPPPAPALRGAARAGPTEALLADAGLVPDDAGDLSWLRALPDDRAEAVAHLRRLLEEDPDPVGRHLVYGELEDRLYRSRDDDPDALGRFDAVCRAHDAELGVIREALVTRLGGVPVLDTYRQMTARLQRVANWPEADRWARRGLALYDGRAMRPEAVTDLEARLAAYRRKLRRP
jgi:hypothetical protein